MGRKWLVFDRAQLGKTIAYGWASAMQQATVQLGKLGIQAIVNSMGVSIAAAFAVVNRIDDFAYTPEQNIGHAMTALMAQNEDTNIVRRAGKDGLEYVKRLCTDADAADADTLMRMDDELIRRNISPGGSADLLAAALMLYFAENDL